MNPELSESIHLCPSIFIFRVEPRSIGMYTEDFDSILMEMAIWTTIASWLAVQTWRSQKFGEEYTKLNIHLLWLTFNLYSPYNFPVKGVHVTSLH